MARNRRHVESRAGSVPASVAALIVALGAVGLGYVGIETKCDTLGREIKRFEAERTRLREDLSRNRGEWARLSATGSVEAALKTHGLVMSWPAADQVVRLGGEPRGALASRAPRPVETPSSHLRTGVVMAHD